MVFLFWRQLWCPCDACTSKFHGHIYLCSILSSWQPCARATFQMLSVASCLFRRSPMSDSLPIVVRWLLGFISVVLSPSVVTLEPRNWNCSTFSIVLVLLQTLPSPCTVIVFDLLLLILISHFRVIILNSLPITHTSCLDSGNTVVLSVYQRFKMLNPSNYNPRYPRRSILTYMIFSW